MTDEEYGRAWAAENKIPPPGKVATNKYLWYDPEFNGYPHFHGALCVCIDRGNDFYKSESEAYADLGRAVQEIRREIPALKETVDSDDVTAKI